MFLWLTMLAWASAEPPLRLRNARLWDGTGAPARTDQWIEIVNDRITAIGDEPAAPGGHRDLDVGGRTVIPGLIDAHVHVEAVPGASIRGDSEAAIEAAQQRGLRAYVACGVTTVLDAGISWPALGRVRGWLANGAVGPRVLTLGPVLGPENGYVEAFLPGHVGTNELDEVTAHLNRLVEAGALGVKLTIEPGYVLPVLPMHTPELRTQIAEAATARGLPVLIHAQHHDAHEAALDLSPLAVLHMVRDQVATPDLVARYVTQQTWLVTTLSIDAAPLRAHEPEPWSSPLEQLVIPPDQRETATSRTGWRAWKQGMGAAALPGMAPWLRRLGLSVTPIRRLARRGTARSTENARRMHAAGVKLVVGSDAGAYDAIPFYFHGLSTLQEIALLVRAGLTPEDALLAATSRAAAMLGLEGEVGVVVPGASADLVVLDADPLVDVSALHQVRWIVRAGELRTPEDWMNR
ncbi:MAG: imidazolonepropionase-like amidohydrolase [Myxococcota bacterium]